MRAAVIQAFDTPPVVTDFPAPEGREGLEVADVLAAGLNPVDLRIASGTFHGLRPEPPYVIGREAVVRLPDGTRAYADSPAPPHGGAAERTLLYPEYAIALPDGLDDAQALGLGVAGLAAWLALEWRARVRPGDRVLVLGATGVVGLVGVQAARLLGAGRVVAAGRDAAGLRRARAAGADAVVALGEPEDLAAAFRDAAEGPLDVVLDPLWWPPAVAALRACAPFARHVQVGQSAGAQVELPSALVRGTPLDILGHTNGAAPWEVRRSAYERMAGYAVAGELEVPVETLPLEAAPAAWDRQAASPNVKLVLRP
jgi:NADPH2:quinone reductase